MAAANSIAFRVRRVTTESCHVVVPVTEEILSALSRKDTAALTAAVCRLAVNADNDWVLDEAPALDLHPIQTPKP